MPRSGLRETREPGSFHACPKSPPMTTPLPFASAAPSAASRALVRTRTPREVRQSLIERREIALLDVREEAPFAEGHPLFAAQLSLSRLELEVYRRIPRRDTEIVVYDDGEGLAARAARRLGDLGYTEVHLLEGGLAGWVASGGELFRDVNVPSKAFGELVEVCRHTPSLSAQEVKALLDERAGAVVLDARRFDEYRTMSIPGGISVPGGELVLRARALAPDPRTRIIVNCAGRTRSIIGTQSLVNAGLPNPVAALRNGTIGWALAGQSLEHGAARSFADVPAVDAATRATLAAAARRVADRARVGRAVLGDLARWRQELARTTYVFDVRTVAEYDAGHLPGAWHVPGGQLVQETDVSAPVRGARLVLVDGGVQADGVRANMTASWLAQMGWEVHVLDDAGPQHCTESGAASEPLPPVPEPRWVSPEALATWLAEEGRPAPGATVVLDVTTSARYVEAHVPGAWFVLRADLPRVLARWPQARRIVLTCRTSRLALHAAVDLAAPDAGLPAGAEVFVLEGGNVSWQAAGLPVESGDARLASPRTDRYRRPYEGTDNPAAAMQAYLDWEFGLVAQLERDGTHGFFVV